MARKAPPLGPTHRGGVALPFHDCGITKVSIPDPDLAGHVLEALRRLPMAPGAETRLCALVPTMFVTKLKPFTPGVDDPLEWVAAELTRSIQAGILMERLPEFEHMTNRQKLRQLDELDAAISHLDDAFGQLQRETWSEIVAVKPDLPPEPTIVRESLYNAWSGLYEAVRESRRRLQNTGANRGAKPNRPATRARDEAAGVYRWITGKEAKIHWNDTAGEYRGEFLSFLADIFGIFGIDGQPAHYARRK